jgi:hypothetical protein
VLPPYRTWLGDGHAMLPRTPQKRRRRLTRSLRHAQRSPPHQWMVGRPAPCSAAKRPFSFTNVVHNDARCQRECVDLPAPPPGGKTLRISARKWLKLRNASRSVAPRQVMPVRLGLKCGNPRDLCTNVGLRSRRLTSCRSGTQESTWVFNKRSPGDGFSLVSARGLVPSGHRGI